MWFHTQQISSPTCSLVHHISSEWFWYYLHPEVMKCWTEVLNTPPKDAKVPLNLHCAPSHHNIKKFSSHNGKIRCLVLCSNVGSMIWWTDHGPTLALTMFYTDTTFLNEMAMITEQFMAGMHKSQHWGAWTTKFCSVVSAVCRSLVPNLLHATILTPRILR